MLSSRLNRQSPSRRFISTKREAQNLCLLIDLHQFKYSRTNTLFSHTRNRLQQQSLEGLTICNSLHLYLIVCPSNYWTRPHLPRVQRCPADCVYKYSLYHFITAVYPLRYYFVTELQTRAPRWGTNCRPPPLSLVFSTEIVRWMLGVGCSIDLTLWLALHYASSTYVRPEQLRRVSYQDGRRPRSRVEYVSS